MKNFILEKNYKILKQYHYKIDNYSLRPVLKEDIEKIISWRNQQIKVLRQNKPISQDEQIQYYKNNIWNEYNQDHPNQILFSFNLNENLIGYGGLVHINWKSMVAEMSFLLETLRTKNKKNYQNDMKNFISILISIAFNELNFKKITTESFNFRKRTIEVLNESNFKIDKNANTHLGKQNSVFHSIINRK